MPTAAGHSGHRETILADLLTRRTRVARRRTVRLWFGTPLPTIAGQKASAPALGQVALPTRVRAGYRSDASRW